MLSTLSSSLSSLVLLLLFVSTCSAFVTLSNGRPMIIHSTLVDDVLSSTFAKAWGQRQESPKKLRCHHARSYRHSLNALVYGADGKVVKDNGDNSNPSTSNDDDYNNLPLLDELQSEIAQEQLARLACAFAPPPHTTIRPANVVNAYLVAVTKDKFEIAASVPTDTESVDQQQLVQVLVSISFPGDVKQKEQILEHIRKLDTTAVKKIAQQEKEADEATTSAPLTTMTVSATLDAEPFDVNWPEWWTIPGINMMLAEECKTLKKLLNSGEFEMELRALCAQQLQNSSSDKKSPIQRARVAAIGPSGIFLRAVLDRKHDTVVDVPIRFVSGEQTTAEDLRESVLTIMDSVEYPVPSLPLEDISVPVEDVVVTASSEEDTEGVSQEEQSVVVKQFKEAMSAGEEKPTLSAEAIKDRRRQPKSSDVEAKLAAKYAAIEDIGERAYTILKDLAMI